MDGDQIGRMIYLLMLLVAVGGYFIVANRHRAGQMLQQAAVWGLIFLGVIAGVGLWGDIRHTAVPRQSVFADDGRIELPRAPDGHFYLTAEVNGKPVQFVVDTGAGQIVLTQDDAARVGLPPEDLNFFGEARTANGVVKTASVRLDEISVGGISDTGVRAWVNGGEMDQSLMGMGYLQRFERVEFTRDTMILTR
ncbi:aspartyl protease-like protein [Actibacterium atlanticum]|uniref:Aspartyl protease-like protein n=1 Tax=Actibacterium atlanticum TaxID=1461693 RepID=A0A058ZRM5_9RHOB|nr:TIGR02281 family clan AA aspartic protease [Actibacterium atlanticum]KCV83802.1 aspartyl protease-like protein [Actibacterium atlanticum]